MEATGVSTPDMFWDDGFDSWNAFGVRGQPAWMLLDEFGQELIEPRFGAIDEDMVLETVGSRSA